MSSPRVRLLVSRRPSSARVIPTMMSTTVAVTIHRVHSQRCHRVYTALIENAIARAAKIKTEALANMRTAFEDNSACTFVICATSSRS